MFQVFKFWNLDESQSQDFLISKLMYFHSLHIRKRRNFEGVCSRRYLHERTLNVQQLVEYLEAKDFDVQKLWRLPNLGRKGSGEF